MSKTAFILVSIIFILFSGCELSFLNNPVDPEAADYQGVETVKDIDSLKPLELAAPGYFSFQLGVTPCADATAYQFQISSSIDFSNPEYDEILASYAPEIPGGGLSTGSYYWRARGRSGADSWGAWLNPEDLQLTALFTGLRAADGGRAAYTTLEFSWDDVVGADHYEIQIADSEAGVASSTFIDCSTNSHELTESLVIGDQRWWRVRAIESDGQVSLWSDIVVVVVFGSITPMVSITGGSFIMGDTWGDGDSDETPTHTVTLSDYSLAQTEVTWTQWDEVYQWAIANGYSFGNTGRAGDDGLSGGDTADEPVTCINWRDAIVWCNAASEYQYLTPVYTYNTAVIRDSRDSWACDHAAADWLADGYRLPTEAEWEYAAKGGQNDSDSGEYAGSRYIDTVAWYYGNSGNDTKTVGTKAANELGLYDMSGNVWEWCWDWYGSYGSTSETDPSGPGSGSYRVVRGGSCTSYTRNSSYCRVANRSSTDPTHGYSNFGFRPVLSR